MATRLALDLGTNSIGWALYQLGDGAKRNEPIALQDAGVRIFPDGREAARVGKVGVTLASVRRKAKGTRRNRDRTQQRKRELTRVLTKLGLLPDDEGERASLLSNRPLKVENPAYDLYDPLDPLWLRARAVDEVLEPYELGRALFHLGQRRGFKSNRKTDSISDEDDATGEPVKRKKKARKEETVDEKQDEATKRRKIKEGISKLEQELATSQQTMGQWLWERRQRGELVRFRAGIDYFPSRKLVEIEFKRIQGAQARHHDVSDENWDHIADLILWQRPLKKVERGHCSIYDKEYRIHKAIPTAQRYLIAHDLHNLRWVDEEGEPHKLDVRQRTCLLEQLDHKASLSNKDLKEAIDQDGEFLFPKVVSFNFRGAKEEKLTGNTTACRMRKKEYFGDGWDELDLDAQDQIVQQLMNADTDENVASWLEKTYPLLFEDQRRKTSKIQFSRLTLRLGPTAVREGIECFKEGKDYEKLWERSEKKEERNYLERMPYYGTILRESVVYPKLPRGQKKPKDIVQKNGRVANTTVHIALRQLELVVNAIIDQHGKPDQVIVETGRDLKNSAKDREKIMKGMEDNRKENKSIDKRLEKLGVSHPTSKDRDKFRFWEELGKNEFDRRCLYCGQAISASQLFNGEIEIDHILPRGQTHDDSRANRTVAHTGCNKKKGDQSPYEAFSGCSTWHETLRALEQKSFRKSKKWRFQKDAMDRFRDQDKFLDSQLTDNAWIAKAALRCLEPVCSDVWCSTGKLTSTLRFLLELNMPDMGLGEVPHSVKKNRFDHRHHAVDAIVTGLVDRSLLQSCTTHRDDRGKQHIRITRLKDYPWLKGQAKEILDKIVISYKPDHGLSGPIFDGTAYGPVPADRLDREDERLANYNWVARKKFVELGIVSDKGPSEVERIRDPALRKKVLAFLSSYPDSERLTKDASKKVSKERLTRFKEVKDHSHWRNIKSVRLLKTGQAIKLNIGTAKYKGYDRGAYAFVDIWRVPNGKPGKWKAGKYKFLGIFVGYDESTKIANGEEKRFLPERMEGIAKYKMRLFKDDVVAITEKKERQLMLIKSYNASAGQLVLAPIRMANPTFADCLQRTINVLFSEQDLRRFYITPAGQVRNPDALKMK